MMDIQRCRLPAPPGTTTGHPELDCVLHVVGTYLPPSEHWVYDQMRTVRGYRSAVAAKRLQDPAAHPWSPVYSASFLPLHARLIERASRKLRIASPFLDSVARAEHALLLHAHGGLRTGMALLTSERLGIPLVTSFYGFDMWKHPEGNAGLRRRYRRLFASAARFVVEGPAAARQLVRIGAPEERIRVHRLGVDASALTLRERRPEPGTLRVLMAARYAEKKGLPDGLEAFCRVARRQPGMRLTIVGGGSGRQSRRISKQLDEILQRYGMQQRVQIVRFMPLDQLLQLADEHDVLLHPSMQAASGDSEGGHPVIMTLLAATGMPIIATDHCDIPEIVRDGETGWICEERDIACLDRALEDALEDSARLAEMGRAARAHVVARYDLQNSTLDPIYDEVLGRPDSTASQSSSMRA